MPDIQTSAQSEDFAHISAEALASSIEQDFELLAGMFACLSQYDGDLDGEEFYGIVRARAAIERGIELARRLSRRSD